MAIPSTAVEDPEDSQPILQELDPSPVEDTPAEEPEQTHDNYFEHEPKPAQHASTLGLGNHGPAFYLARVQRYSSYAFTVFAAFHITNTSLIPLATRSIAAGDRYLLLTRPYYQSLPFEPLLITAPLALHVSSGLALRLYRRRQQVHRYGADSRSERRGIPWPRVSGTSLLGYALAPLVAGHAFINRVIPLMYEGGSANVGLEYVSHGFAKAPVVSFVGFTALVGVGVWHGVWGWANWLKVAPVYVTQAGPEGNLVKKRRWYILNGVAAVVAGLWLAGGLGVVGRGEPATGWLAKEYDELLKHIPIFGQWL